MKTILFTIIFIIAILWVGDLTITFKPFSISLPSWYKALGILLFFLSMTVYNIGEYTKGYKQGFDDGVKECVEIHIFKRPGHLTRKSEKTNVEPNSSG